MNTALDDRIVASFLESGRTLARASAIAALIAGIGGAVGHTNAPRIVFGGSLVFWVAGCWLAVRVAIDASLLRDLAGEPDDGWRRLDQLLEGWNLRRTAEDRRISDRRRGAIALWRKQAIVLAIQLAVLIGAVLLEAAGF